MDNAPKLKESMVDMQDEDFTDESDEEDWSIKIMEKTFVIKIHLHGTDLSESMEYLK